MAHAGPRATDEKIAFLLLLVAEFTCPRLQGGNVVVRLTPTVFSVPKLLVFEDYVCVLVFFVLFSGFGS